MGIRSHTAVDRFELILLGTISLGVIAWFSRYKLFGPSSSPNDPASNSITKRTTPEKPERNFVKVMEQQKRQCIVFYGSQTGTAEDYASQLARDCTQRYGVSAMVADIEQYDLNYLDTLSKHHLVFFVLATYGEGEPTDNAVDFWELLTHESVDEDAYLFSKKEKTAGDKPLNKVRYVLFGLGNKTYENYNAVARTVDQHLQRLGAQRTGERGEGDDDESMEEDFLEWQVSMWVAFCHALGVDENSTRSGPRQATYTVEELDSEDDLIYYGEIAERTLDEGSIVVYDAKRPYNAPITTRELYQDGGGDRHCLHVDINISNTNLNYQTGDHVAVWPTNSDDQISLLASALGLSEKLNTVIMVKSIDTAASKQHPFPVPTTYHAIFRHYIDICAIPSRQALMSLVEYAPTDKSKAALLKLASDKDEYRLTVSDSVRSLGEVLSYVMDDAPVDGSFAQVPFDLIVENVSRLQPRYYSISSSAKECPTLISATAVTLRYSPESTTERTVYGVNTNYLWQIHAKVHNVDDGLYYPHYNLDGPRGALIASDTSHIKIPIHIRRSPFKLPRNTGVPIILVGPGAGVAPFRGFVRERVLQKKNGKSVGPTLLFYGCRHSRTDFIYADEWPELFAALGDGSRLITAFSRETSEKVYVQHRLKEYGHQVWEYLKLGGYVYVCGDAKHMARDVQQTFVAIAQLYGDKTEERANAFIKSLRNSGRYQEDVWS